MRVSRRIKTCRSIVINLMFLDIEETVSFEYSTNDISKQYKVKHRLKYDSKYISSLFVHIDGRP